MLITVDLSRKDEIATTKKILQVLSFEQIWYLLSEENQELLRTAVQFNSLKWATDQLTVATGMGFFELKVRTGEISQLFFDCLGYPLWTFVSTTQGEQMGIRFEVSRQIFIQLKKVADADNV